MNIDGRVIAHEVLESYRFAAIALNKEGVHPNIIAKSFGVTRQAVYRWFRNYDDAGTRGIQATTGNGRQLHLTEEQFLELCKLLRLPASELGYTTDLWSGTKVRHLIKNNFGIEYHQKHIPRLLRRLGLWLVFPERRALEQDLKEVKKWKLRRLPKILAETRRNKGLVFYADESLISLIPYVGKTWSFPEDKPVVYVSGLRGQHVGVTAAVNQQGRMSFELTREKERFTSKVFIRFIKKMRAEYPKRFLSLIVDGAPTHKAKIVKSFVADNQKWLRLEILPAYSPELNPTEKSWRFLKTKKLNASAAKSKAELRKTVAKALRSTKKDHNKVAEFFNK